MKGVFCTNGAHLFTAALLCSDKKRCIMLPWYNHHGWLGVKNQFPSFLPQQVSKFPVLRALNWFTVWQYLCPSSQSFSLMSVCHLFLVFRTCSPMKLAAASKWGYPSHWAEILGRGGRFMTHTLPLTLGGVHSGHKHTHTHTHLTDCTIKVKEAMVRKGFWWFFFGHQSQIQQVDAIQKMYKIDVRALVKTLYSQVSFAVQRMKWKSFMNISQECLCNFCKGIGSCARLTQIYTNTLLYTCELELPTNQAVGSTMPADSMPFTIPSNLTCAVCWTTHGRHISSQPHSHSPIGIWLEVIFMSFQTYIITDLCHH